jgi:hypothetical protein
MNESIDQLLSLAEISGIFLGFAGLTTAVLDRGDATKIRMDLFSLITIAIVCALIIIGALLPMTLQHFLSSEESLWRASALGLYSANLASIYITTQLTPGYSETHTTRGVQAKMVWLSEPLLHISLILCIFNLWTGHGVALYFTALIFMFLQVLMMFVFFILRFNVPSIDADKVEK